MKHLIALVVVALLVAGCSSKGKNASSQNAAAQGGLSVSTSFNPDPPRQGAQALTITVRNADGTPTKGAIVKVTTQMPTMSMSGPTATATDNGDGTYSANLSLQYATSWHFIITASNNGKTARNEVVEDVK